MNSSHLSPCQLQMSVLPQCNFKGEVFPGPLLIETVRQLTIWMASLTQRARIREFHILLVVILGNQQNFGWCWDASERAPVETVMPCSEAKPPPRTSRGADRDCPNQQKDCLQTYYYKQLTLVMTYNQLFFHKLMKSVEISLVEKNLIQIIFLLVNCLASKLISKFLFFYIINISTMFEENDTASLLEDGLVTSQMWYAANMNLSRSISAEEDQTMNLLPNQSQNIQPVHPPSEEEPPETEGTDSSLQPPKPCGFDYQKNICANIAKKTVQCFMSPNYRKKILHLCSKNGCSFEQVQVFYGKKKNDVFGLTHLYYLVTPENKEEEGIKRVFAAFLRWFLRQRYMVYMLRFGKMSDREKYIEYKNKYLLYIEQTIQPVLMD